MNTSTDPNPLDVTTAEAQLLQLHELHAADVLSDESYDKARARLERRILEQMPPGESAGPALSAPAKRAPPRLSPRWMAALAGLLVIASVAAYQWTRYSSVRASSMSAGTLRVGSTATLSGASAGNPHAAILDELGGIPDKAADTPQDKPSAVAAGQTLSGTVTLAGALAKEAKPDDTVFIFARVAEGSRMPLAILRKQVKDLPIQFTLDDGTAMSEAIKLSELGRLIVVARISKGANGVPQKGDLTGYSAPVALGTRGMAIEITEVVKE
jgi:hypothetical protein